MITAWWQRPYKRVEEGDSTDALIAYSERPVRFENVRHGPDHESAEPTEFACRLLLNLWIVQLRIGWTRRVSRPLTPYEQRLALEALSVRRPYQQ